MNATPETLRTIGQELEELTFFSLRRGTPKKVRFAGSTSDEAEPVIEVLAAQYEVPVNEVTAVAGLVRAFDKAGKRFTEFYDLAADLQADGRLEPLVRIMELDSDAKQAS